MYKKRVFAFLFVSCLSIFIFLMIAGYVCKLDPLYLFYHGEKYEVTKEMKLHDNMRLQARGIINLYDFDSIIIGSSMLQNTSSVLTSNILGEKFINLSLNASNFAERSYVLEYALKKQKIKTVIYSIDSFHQRNCLSTTPPEWANVYSDNFLEAIKIYFQKDFIKFIFPAYDNRSFNIPDKLGQWFERFKQLFGGLENWVNIDLGLYTKTFLYIKLPKIIAEKKMNKISSYKDDDMLLKKSIEKNLLYFVKNNPQTNFYFILPPHWRGVYALMLYAPDKQFNYAFHQEIIRNLVQLSSQYKNMFIFAFELEPFINDIKNYCDIVHYHPDINTYMIECIKK